MSPHATVGKISRGPRRTPEEIRDLLIATGVKIVLTHGLGNLSEYLTFKRTYEVLATEDVHLTNGSVIGRVFQSQEEFHHRVLLEIAKSESEDFNVVAARIINEVMAKADRSTEDARWFALSEMCRIGSRLMMDTLHDSPTWRTWIGIWAMVGSSPRGEHREELTEALRASYVTLNRDTAVVLDAAIGHLGFRLKKPYTMKKVASIVISLSEGSSIREFVENSRSRHVSLPTGPGGINQKWTLFGLGFFAMAKEFAEIDPKWNLMKTD